MRPRLKDILEKFDPDHDASKQLALQAVEEYERIIDDLPNYTKMWMPVGTSSICMAVPKQLHELYMIGYHIKYGRPAPLDQIKNYGINFVAGYENKIVVYHVDAVAANYDVHYYPITL